MSYMYIGGSIIYMYLYVYVYVHFSLHIPSRMITISTLLVATVFFFKVGCVVNSN